MELSKKALEDLRISIVKEVGLRDTSQFSDEDLNEIGMFLLTILAESLKMKMSEERSTIS